MDRCRIKTKPDIPFSFSFPSTTQRHLCTTQQRNTQSKPTTRRQIQPRRRRLPQRRVLQRHERNRMLGLHSGWCSRKRRNPAIHRGQRRALIRTRGGIHGRSFHYFGRGRWIAKRYSFEVGRICREGMMIGAASFGR